ncbi:MAG: tripartite tricarboxylate transporter substrate binding protein [Pseudomonadales bacterium]|nr:tripartite tricarboxylate transporter substrate binding protein [Pseudomonadales bacterium]
MTMTRLCCTLLLLLSSALPLKAEVLPEVHFLIPAGPGGGWDGTARGVGEAMVKSHLVDDVSFENLSGGGGGRAIAKLIETADRQQYTLLISSTPMVVRSLQKVFPQSFRDLVPVATVIADYSAFVVPSDSPLQNFADVVAQFASDPRSVKVAGGSVKGSTDHFIFAKAIEMAGGDPRKVVYIPYDGGGKAMAGILSGETQLLSTGLSEAIDMARAGEARVIAITAPARLPDAPELPTLTEQGYALEFANWRGFFAAKGLPAQRYADMQETIARLLATPEFEAVRKRNGWTLLHREGTDFYQFLEQQEQEVGQLMRNLGFLRP